MIKKHIPRLVTSLIVPQNKNHFLGTCPCKRYYRNGCPLLNCIPRHSFIQQIYCPAQIVLFRLSKSTKVIFQITIVRSQSSMVSLKIFSQKLSQKFCFKKFVQVYSLKTRSPNSTLKLSVWIHLKSIPIFISNIQFKLSNISWKETTTR